MAATQVLAPPAFEATALAGWRGKRAMDVALSLLLVVVLVPVLLAVTLVVKTTSRGPVLFRQRRVGLGGRHFSIMKFRTMRISAEEELRQDGELLARYVAGDFKLANDPRVTKVGRVLRASSLDELPQLFNVLAGHMSLVGPRPVTPAEVGLYADNQDAYCSVRPGLTGLWQVSGRNHIKFPERAHVDAEYCLRCSPALDLHVLLRTPGAVLSRRGAI